MVILQVTSNKMEWTEMILQAIADHFPCALMADPASVGTVLIVGASGVIGASAVALFGSEPGWRVLALSRRPPDVPAGVAFEHIPVDLTDVQACCAAAERFADVTHVIYAALYEKWLSAGLV